MYRAASRPPLVPGARPCNRSSARKARCPRTPAALMVRAAAAGDVACAGPCTGACALPVRGSARSSRAKTYARRFTRLATRDRPRLLLVRREDRRVIEVLGIGIVPLGLVDLEKARIERACGSRVTRFELCF